MNHLLETDRLSVAFKEAFEGLTEEELNWKPGPEVWSIAQNIEHLIIINSSYFPVIEQLRKGNYQTPWTAKLGFMTHFFGRLILKAVEPERKKKIRTFSIWEPQKSHIKGDILKSFLDRQEDLKHFIRESEDWIRKGTVICSPAKKQIVYRLETALDIILTHEQRHLNQAQEVKNILK